jgi:hypothetical protein
MVDFATVTYGQLRKPRLLHGHQPSESVHLFHFLKWIFFCPKDQVGEDSKELDASYFFAGGGQS